MNRLAIILAVIALAGCDPSTPSVTYPLCQFPRGGVSEATYTPFGSGAQSHITVVCKDGTIIEDLP